MQTTQHIRTIAGILVTLLAAVPADGLDFNKSIDIPAGSESDGGSTVSGSIRVGAGAIVNGRLETVNGSIDIDEDARIESAETVNGSVKLAGGVSSGELSTVNGSIRIGEGGTVDGSVATVNGRIELGSRATIREDIGNVNGAIRVSGAEIGGDLTTVNGDVALERDSVLRGDLVVEDAAGNWSRGKDRPRVVIGPGARVEGEIRLEREVELYISETAQVGGVSGEMTLADAVRFRGETP